jgi:methionyl-tRNA formyltransferase
MKRFLFFAYRDWAINIFKNVNNTEDEYILLTNKELCTLDFINTIKPDVIFFYGWSWIVKEEIINQYTCLCLHPSRLPKYRGGTPIQNQIMNNEYNSAVTIFKMGKGIDDGSIYFQSQYFLIGYLQEILRSIERVGTTGTKNFIMDFKNDDDVKFVEQNEKEATIYKRLKSENSEIKPEDFSNHDARYFFNKVRGLQKPYPEAFIKCKTGKIILKNIEYEDIQDISDISSL